MTWTERATTAPGTNRSNTLYRMFDKNNRLLYVGMSVRPARRFAHHQGHAEWWRKVSLIRLEHFVTRAELEAAEIKAIALEHPIYNVKRNVIPDKARESAQRLSHLTDDQRHWFKAIRYLGHRSPNDRQLNNAVQKARECGVSDEDVQWALGNPRRARP